MTVRYDRALQCAGKVRYTSRRLARIGRRHSPAAGHLRIYRCGWCDTYHLGHVRPHAIRDAELLELAERDPAAADRMRRADLGLAEEVADG